MPLQLLQVDATAFMGQSFSYNLPPKGLVLVQGTNGSGKSSRFIDSVSFALWGKTERGVDPWGEAKGSLVVQSNEFTVAHSWTGKSASQRIQLVGETEIAATTRTALAQISAQRYMPFEAWKLCARFTSADISAFSRAVASKELAMLESVLGLSWIKKASATAEKEYQAAVRHYTQTYEAYLRSQSQVAQIIARQDTAATALGSPPVPPAEERPAEYAAAQQKKHTCPTCGASTYHVDALTPEALAANRAYSAWQQYEQELARYTQMRERLNVSRLQAQRLREEALCLDAHLELAQSELETATWGEVRSVFKPGGLREHLLSQELKRISHLATHYCTVMGLDSQISLTIQDNGKLDLSVTGVGGKHGYAGASSGQRRRIDIALSLALTSNTHYKDGPLWFDEVFDTLDVEGVERVAQLILHLGSVRQVLLLTHKKEALQLLQPLAAKTITLG